MAPPVLERVGRLADGWMPQRRPPEELERNLAQVRAAAEAAGRDPAAIGVEVQLPLARLSGAGAGAAGSATVDYVRAADEARRWGESGVSHLSVSTMGAGWRSADEHTEALARFRDAFGPSAAAQG